MKVSKKIYIGNQNSNNPDEQFGIAKFYGPNEQVVDNFINKIADLFSADGLTVEIHDSRPDTTRKWKVVNNG